MNSLPNTLDPDLWQAILRFLETENYVTSLDLMRVFGIDRTLADQIIYAIPQHVKEWRLSRAITRQDT